MGIVDVTDNDDPVGIAKSKYPRQVFSHRGWLDEQHEYFYMNDEYDEFGSSEDGPMNTRTVVWGSWTSRTATIHRR